MTIQEKLASIKRICQPHIQDLVKESVEKICIKMFNFSQEYALRLRTNHLKLLQQNGISVPELLLNGIAYSHSCRTHDLPFPDGPTDLNLEHVVQTPFHDPLKIEENKLITKPTEQGNHELVACHPLGLACPCPLFTSPNTQVSATVRSVFYSLCFLSPWNIPSFITIFIIIGWWESFVGFSYIPVNFNASSNENRYNK